MEHETVNTGFVFLVLFYKDTTKGKTWFDNAIQQSSNPYHTYIKLRSELPNTIDIVLINWSFISEETYRKLKTISDVWKHIPNGPADGGGL